MDQEILKEKLINTIIGFKDQTEKNHAINSKLENDSLKNFMHGKEAFDLLSVRYEEKLTLLQMLETSTEAYKDIIKLLNKESKAIDVVKKLKNNIDDSGLKNIQQTLVRKIIKRDDVRVYPLNYHAKNKATIDKDEVLQRMNHFLCRDALKVENSTLDVCKILDHVTAITNFCSFEFSTMAFYVAKLPLITYYDMIKRIKKWDSMDYERKCAMRRLYSFVMNKDAILYLNSIFPKKVHFFMSNYINIPTPRNLSTPVSDIIPISNAKDKLASNLDSSSTNKISYKFKNKFIDMSKLNTMTIQDLGFIGKLDVGEVCEDIKQHLLEKGICREIFAEKILGLKKHKSIYVLLSNYKKWEDLSKTGKEIYVKMKAYLDCYKELEKEFKNDDDENDKLFFNDENFIDNVDYSFLDKKSLEETKDNEYLDTENGSKILSNINETIINEEDSDEMNVSESFTSQQEKNSSSGVYDLKENYKPTRKSIKRKHLENETNNNVSKRQKVPEYSFLGSDNIYANNLETQKETSAITEKLSNTLLLQQKNSMVKANESKNYENIVEKLEYIEDDIYVISCVNTQEQQYDFNKHANIDQMARNFYKTTVSGDYLITVNVYKLELLTLAWSFTEEPPQLFKNYLSEFSTVPIDTVETFYDKTNKLYQKLPQNITSDGKFKKRIREIINENTSRKCFISITTSIFECLFNGKIPSLICKV
uniref:CUT domain-containing protein n=1 Tax=Parastrongyloides trichosuri TaxID=131310 RepID=A0A0N4Z9M7_PARTI